jgi:hypothetical protein
MRSLRSQTDYPILHCSAHFQLSCIAHNRDETNGRSHVLAALATEIRVVTATDGQTRPSVTSNKVLVRHVQ